MCSSRVSRKRKGDFGELRHRDLHVDGSRVVAAMAEQVGDLVDRSSPADELGRQAMPDEMGTGGTV
ncbi:hypothetical protein [Microvirga sp. KLBC 81]|uniref:hypothetical protein n=1 Tax=Microvirga sp. KLBC 81 TaxID=1862707 RepID=UPI001FE03A92|nr:hypothetical protein [Microvirga sp. KLBC 81]